MGSGRLTLSCAPFGVAVFAMALGVTLAGTQQEPAPKPAANPPDVADPDFPPLKLIAFDVVESATNKPIDGVKLTARLNNQQRTWTTDEAGHARLDVDGGARSLTITATRDGYVPMTVTWTSPRPRESALPGEYLLKMERGTTIGGAVTDEAGKPIAGADVTLSIQRKGEGPRGRFAAFGGPAGGSPQQPSERAAVTGIRLKTDPEGRWQFDQAPANVETVRVQLAHPDVLRDDPTSPRTPPLLEKLRDRSAVMVMNKGVTVAGRVTDAQGNPVAGAQVSFGARRFGNRASPTVTSGADGRFELPNGRPAPAAALIVRAKGWAPQLKQFALSGPVTDMEVKLEPARVMRVRVVNAKGDPVQGALVRAGSWRGLMSALDWRAQTGPDGRAAWGEAPADAVQIGASARGYVSSADSPVVAGEQEHVITLKSLMKIAGTVLDDATGKPVEKFVAIRGWTSPGRPAPFWAREDGGIPFDGGRVTYGPSGRFEYVENFQQDAYVVRVEAPGYLPAESREIKPGEENIALEIRLKKGKDLVATLKSPDGKPLTGADVLVVTASGQIIVSNGKPTAQTFARRATADDAGHFRLEPQAGQYTVLVLHDRGFAELNPEQLAGDNPTITVGPWATIRGTASIGSKPAAGRTVTAMDASRRAVPGLARLSCSAVADDRGQFVLDRVPPGPVSIGIEVRTPENGGMMRVTWTDQTRIEAEPGKTTEVTLGGKGRPVIGRLSARAEIGDKADWRLADVRLVSRAASRRTYPAVVSAADASFRADDVEAGDYYLTAQLARPTSRDGGPQFGRQAWAAVRREITVAAGNIDDAVDVGKIELSVDPGGGPDPIRRRPTPAPPRQE